MKKILLLLAIIAAFIILSKFGQFGFPASHPISADCIGVKTQQTDSRGINRVQCYGYLFNGWSE